MDAMTRIMKRYGVLPDKTTRMLLTRRLPEAPMTEPAFFQLPLESNNEYTVRYSTTRGGVATTTSVSIMDGSGEDISASLVEEYYEQHKDDPSFKILSVSCERFDLSSRVAAVRAMFELGHKVRAETKIRNRQPLRKAYILFADPKIQSYMQHIDCCKQDYANMFVRELNIFNVEFITGSLDKFFVYVLKPNFRALGQRGKGKEAQQLKKDLLSMSNEERSIMLTALDSQSVEAFGMTLSKDDIEVEYIPKPGFMGATGKVGSIILDTTLDAGLIEHGTVADFKSSMQNVRREAKLELTDRISFDVHCSSNMVNVLVKYLPRLKKELLADNVSFFTGGKAKFDDSRSHLFEVDGESVIVELRRSNDKQDTGHSKEEVVSDVRAHNEEVLGRLRRVQGVREIEAGH
jgi:uncharacterized protein DUF5915